MGFSMSFPDSTTGAASTTPETALQTNQVGPLADRGGRRGRRKILLRLLSYIPALLLFAALIGLWQLYIDLFNVRSIILPTPGAVASTLVDRWSLLEPQLKVTLVEAAEGFLLGASVGLLLAIAINASRILRLALYPLIITSQAIPIIAIAPLLITWFGFGGTSKVLVSALIAFFPMVVSSAVGLSALDSGVVALMRSFPASRSQIFLRARLPNALPQIFAGLKVAAVLSVVGAVVGEWAGANSGLGYLIIRSNASLDTDLVFAAIVLLSLMGIAFFALVSLVERLVMPWPHPHELRL
jgi:ABC-type nitrate/sulfonate/bicarbonate transport system permease component